MISHRGNPFALSESRLTAPSNSTTKYTCEAKWQQDPSPAADLYVFREKVAGKSQFTRGVFLSINGVSREAQNAITRGK